MVHLLILVLLPPKLDDWMSQRASWRRMISGLKSTKSTTNGSNNNLSWWISVLQPLSCTHVSQLFLLNILLPGPLLGYQRLLSISGDEPMPICRRSEERRLSSWRTRLKLFCLRETTSLLLAARLEGISLQVSSLVSCCKSRSTGTFWTNVTSRRRKRLSVREMLVTVLNNVLHLNSLNSSTQTPRLGFFQQQQYQQPFQFGGFAGYGGYGAPGGHRGRGGFRGK